VKGIYVLVVSVDGDTKVNVGALGNTFFKKGLYAYVGSAQKNLKKRIDRHLRKEKRSFWHIDYLLRDVGRVVEVFWKEAEKSEECRVAKELGKTGVPILNFGCSDCSCVSHLFMLGDLNLSMSSLAFLTADFTRVVHA